MGQEAFDSEISLNTGPPANTGMQARLPGRQEEPGRWEPLSSETHSSVESPDVPPAASGVKMAQQEATSGEEERWRRTETTPVCRAETPQGASGS